MAVLRKVARRTKLKAKIRSHVFGTPEKPRLSVFRSNKEIYAQLIDDVHGKTIVAASSKKLTDKINKTEKSAQVGKDIAELALKAGISTVSFDRNGYLYHGRVKSLAEAAREGGLKF